MTAPRLPVPIMATVVPAVALAVVLAVVLGACGSTSGSGAGDPNAAVSSSDQSGQSDSSGPSATTGTGGTETRPTVGGTVRDRAGAPVQGALISLVGTGTTTYPLPEVAILTGADGTWTFTVPGPGTLSVTAQRDGTTTRGDLTVTTAGGRVDLVLG